MEWFRIYKIPAGKPPNSFAFGGEFKDQTFALRIINEMHEQWKKLIGKKCDPGNIAWLVPTTVTLLISSLLLPSVLILLLQTALT